MVMFFLVPLALLVAILVIRRRRKAQLAGLDSNRPVFSIGPPTRRVAKRKHEAL